MEPGTPSFAPAPEGEAKPPVRSAESKALEHDEALATALRGLLKKAAATEGALENPAVVAEAAKRAEWEAEQHSRFDVPGDRR